MKSNTAKMLVSHLDLSQMDEFNSLDAWRIHRQFPPRLQETANPPTLPTLPMSPKTSPRKYQLRFGSSSSQGHAFRATCFLCAMVRVILISFATASPSIWETVSCNPNLSAVPKEGSPNSLARLTWINWNGSEDLTFSTPWFQLAF